MLTAWSPTVTPSCQSSQTSRLSPHAASTRTKGQMRTAGAAYTLRPVARTSVVVVFAVGCASPRSAPPASRTARVPDVAGKSWRPLASQPPFGAVEPLLLTDGRVMVKEGDNEAWWSLTPDDHGSYEHGRWAQLASLPTGYIPLYFASAVLPDGRVIVE